MAQACVSLKVRARRRLMEQAGSSLRDKTGWGLRDGPDSRLRDKAVRWGMLQGNFTAAERQRLLVDAQEKDVVGRTLLHWAVVTRQKELVKELCGILSIDAQEEKDNLGRTPFMLLLQQKSSKRSVRSMARLLPASSWREKDMLGRTCLHYFAGQAHGVATARALCEVLHEQFKKETLPLPIVTDERGNTPLHYITKQQVCTYGALTPFEETGATVVTSFLLDAFPGIISASNNKGVRPMQALARSLHRDPLLLVVQAATPEQLLAVDDQGLSLLTLSAYCSVGMLRTIAVGLPIEALRMLSPEELLGPPLMASLHNAERSLCILEIMDESLPQCVEGDIGRDICIKAAEEGCYSVIAHLMKKEVKSCWATVQHSPGSAYSALTILLNSTKWREEQIASAQEILEGIPEEEFSARVASRANVQRAVCNEHMPRSLVDLCLQRTPKSFFSAANAGSLVRAVAWPYRQLLFDVLPKTVFSDPQFLSGILRRIFLPRDHLTELLELVTDEALEPGIEPPLLELAIHTPDFVELIGTLIMRAPHLRHVTNKNGETILVVARRYHSHYQRGLEKCAELEAMMNGTFTKSARC